MGRDRTVQIEERVRKSDGVIVYDARWYCPDYTYCEKALKAGRKYCRGHKRGTCGLASEAEARALGYAAQNAVKNGGKTLLVAADGTATMNDVADLWFKSGPPKIKSPKTLVGYLGRWQAWNNRNALVGLVPVTAVTKVHVVGWLGELREAGLSKSTMRQDLILLRHILRYAVRLDLIDSDPSEGIEAPESKQGDPDKTPRFTEAQVWQIANELAVMAREDRDRAKAAGKVLPYSRWTGFRLMVLMSAYTGLRMAELIGLRAKYLDRSNQTYVIDVDWQWDEDFGDFRRPKRGRVRPVPVTAELVGDLDEHMRSDPCAEHNHHLVFATSNGTPFLQSNLRKDWHRVLDRLDLPRHRWHSMRSTMVDIWRDRGMEAEDVRDMAGHKDINVTMNTYKGTATVDHLVEVVATASAKSRTEELQQAANAAVGSMLGHITEDGRLTSEGLPAGWTPPEAARDADVVELPT